MPTAPHWQSASAFWNSEIWDMAGGNSVDEAAVRQVLDAIPAPRSDKGLLGAGMVGEAVSDVGEL